MKANASNSGVAMPLVHQGKCGSLAVHVWIKMCGCIKCTDGNCVQFVQFMDGKAAASALMASVSSTCSACVGVRSEDPSM